MTFSFLEAYEVFTYRTHRITTVMLQTSDGCSELSFLVKTGKKYMLLPSLIELLAYVNGEGVSVEPLSKQELKLLKDHLDGKYDT